MFGRAILAMCVVGGIACAEEASPTLVSLPPAADSGVWLDLDSGLAQAKARGLPLFIWLSPCSGCGSKVFDDPDVSEMMSDFVAVKAGPELAPRLGVPTDSAQAVFLDADGQVLDGMAVQANGEGDLPAAEVIDAMSSALDVVR